MTLASEVAYNNGIDFYDHVASGGEKLEYAFDFSADFFRTGESYFDENSNRSIAGIFEVPHKRYPQNQAVVSLLDVLDRPNLPSNLNNYISWATLTHSEQVPNPAAATVGDFLSGKDGWQAANLRFFNHGSNTISGAASTADPQVYRSSLAELKLHTNSYNRIQIRMRVASSITADGTLYWGTTENDGFSAARALNLATIKDGAYHIYELNMTSVTGWTGYLDDLRIDPTNGTADVGKDFNIDWVRLLPRAQPSLGEFRGTFDDWQSSNLSQYTVGTNTISGIAATDNPAVSLYSIGERNLHTAKFDKIQIRMMLEASVVSDAKVSWWTTDFVLVAAPFTTIKDGAYHVYEIDVSANPQWRGAYLHAITINPMNSGSDIGKQFWIDWVRLVRKPGS